ncbi:lipase family protein [Nocardia vinacea]|uniref:Lipase family protein n=1 Tax=Nocardia vinacea TaxID=96468 RepID=A0ABZ1YPC4_9NOCA|nr:alpha/beta fold hydrolase [Nocardia vinacea]
MFEALGTDMALLLARGIAVVVTDYQGLGTPGAHTYLQPLPEAHAALDAARATIRLGLIAPQAPIGIWGYSQGGGAAAAAAEQAHDYAPDLNVRASVVGAPPADPAAVMRNVDGKAFSGIIGYFVNGLLAGYPQLAPAIAATLNAEGLDFIHRTADQCTFGTIMAESFRPTNGYTRSGQTIIDALEAHPGIRAVLDSFVLGKTAPSAPVLLIQNTNDDVVPAGQTLAMVDAWRRGGVNITEANIDSPQLLPQVGIFGHAAGVPASPTASAWLYDQLTH